MARDEDAVEEGGCGSEPVCEPVGEAQRGEPGGRGSDAGDAVCDHAEGESTGVDEGGDDGGAAPMGQLHEATRLLPSKTLMLDCAVSHRAQLLHTALFSAGGAAARLLLARRCTAWCMKMRALTKPCSGSVADCARQSQTGVRSTPRASCGGVKRW